MSTNHPELDLARSSGPPTGSRAVLAICVMVFSGCSRVAYEIDPDRADDGHKTSGGQPVESFGTDGVVTMAREAVQLEAASVLPMADGGLIVAGRSIANLSSNFFLAGFDALGEPNLSFGTLGYTTADPGDTDVTRHLRRAADGGFLIAGSSQVPGGSQMSLMRFTSRGTLDAAFGDGGWATTPAPPTTRGAISIPGTGGAIFVGGAALNGTWSIAVMKVLADGSLDPGFGQGGLRVVALPNDQIVIRGVTSSIGGMLLLIHDDTRAAVRRLTPDGDSDEAFGLGGAVRFAPDDDVLAVRLLSASQGGFAVAGLIEGIGSTTLLVEYYSSDGQPDLGRRNVIVSDLDVDITLEDAIAEDNGALVVTGQRSAGLYVLKIASDSSVDEAFGENGWAVPYIPAESSGGRGLALLDDGTIVVVGSADNAMVIVQLTPGS